jgi:hypothetical protein
MADSKITALTSIGTSTDPVLDQMVIVDVSDGSMAATGTTKKVSLNQLLSSNPSATGGLTLSGALAAGSATITGALTVQGVGGISIGSASFTSGRALSATSPAGSGVGIRLLQSATSDWEISNVATAGNLSITQSGANLLSLTGAGVFTFGDGAGGTRMTLNSTGLGVGVASPNAKLHINGNLKIDGATSEILMATGSERTISASGSSGSTALTFKRWDGVSAYINDFILSGSGNVGVGVTPSAWGSNSKALQVGGGTASVSSTGAGATASRFAHGAYFDNTNWLYQYTGVGPALYQVTGANAGSTHAWYIAPGGTAGNAITFTQAMTLDASGNLLVGTTGLPSSNGRISASSSSSVAPIRAYTSAGDIYPSIIADKSSTTNTTAQVFVAFTVNNQATGSGQINANGASQAAFGTFSDSRLKENIVSLPSQLANILSLRPVEFDYKDGSGHQIGFVAQEIQEVYSDAVGEQNGFLTVTGWSKTEARLVSAIKELAAKVQALEAKLA